VAIVTGSSRGIGRELALAFARAGAKGVVIAARTNKPHQKLSGTIHSVSKEVDELGSCGMAVKVDVRDEASIQRMVMATIEKFGHIDILVNNAGALWWRNVIDTPMDRYDMVAGVNSRASFACCRAVLPHMLKQKHGRIILMSPPINVNVMAGKVGYYISKYGMTLLAHGLGQELKGSGVTLNALWPKTLIQSPSTTYFKIGNPSSWRKASIVVDAVLSLVLESDHFTGEALFDEDYLKSKGTTNFSKYRCDPDVEPPQSEVILLALQNIPPKAKL